MGFVTAPGLWKTSRRYRVCSLQSRSGRENQPTNDFYKTNVVKHSDTILLHRNHEQRWMIVGSTLTNRYDYWRLRRLPLVQVFIRLHVFS